MSLSSFLNLSISVELSILQWMSSSSCYHLLLVHSRVAVSRILFYSSGIANFYDMLFDSKDLKLCVYKFNRDEAAGGEDEVGQAAAARRLRLQALKEANELLSTPDEGSRQDETEETEDAEEEM